MSGTPVRGTSTDAEVVPLDRSQIPGAFEIHTQRKLADGTIISFESAPIGWLTKAGEPRRAPWRAYFVERPGEKRQRVPSVTTLLNELLPKDLSWWSEEQGILGMAELVRRGEWNPIQHTPEDAVHRVRKAKLGKDAAKDRAAGRGTDAHSIVEAFLTEGKTPRPSDWPPELHGYVIALTKWLLDAKPDPILVERLVYSDYGYAGRADLLARIDGTPTLVDFKTSGKGMTWPTAQAQTAMYRRALCEGGDCDPDIPARIVVFAPTGSYYEIPTVIEDDGVAALFAWREVLKPAVAACESHNRRIRKALAA